METPQLSEDLTKEAVRTLQKVGAYIGSKGDATVMASFQAPPSTMLLLGITVILLFIVWVVSEFGKYQEITKNWSHYRCDPAVMPFAKFYGHDLGETMNFCIGESVKEHAPGVINPIYSAINEVSTVVDGVYTKAEAMEGGIMGLLKGFESFVLEFANSFRLIGSRVQMSLVRIKDIFGRVYGTFIAFAYAGISAITFGTNLINNPLVTFIDDIGCFPANTSIPMANGTMKGISDVAIGDRLTDGSTVTSTYRFDGSRTKMVTIHGITVSGNHYVWDTETGQGIRADEYEGATPTPSCTYMFCLATTSHRIPVFSPVLHQTLTFVDYEESSDPTIIAAVQRVAELALNGQTVCNPVLDYSLGLDPRLRVRLSDGSDVSLMNLRVGDYLANGACVFGTIREQCDSLVVDLETGIFFSAAQLLFDVDTNLWVRAKYLYSSVVESTEELCQQMVHVMLSDNRVLHVHTAEGIEYSLRDYAEVHISDIQTPYDAAVLHGSLSTH